MAPQAGIELHERAAAVMGMRCLSGLVPPCCMAACQFHAFPLHLYLELLLCCMVGMHGKRLGLEHLTGPQTGPQLPYYPARPSRQ